MNKLYAKLPSRKKIRGSIPFGPNVRFADGAHHGESVVVLHEGTDIRRKTDLWDTLLVTQERLYSLLLIRGQIVDGLLPFSSDIVFRGAVKESASSRCSGRQGRIDKGLRGGEDGAKENGSGKLHLVACLLYFFRATLGRNFRKIVVSLHNKRGIWDIGDTFSEGYGQ